MNKLTNERKERLLTELLRYRYERENNTKALKKLKEKLEIIKSEVSATAVAYQSERIKEENSFLNKINNKLDKNEELSYDMLHDIVGARLVCLNLTDAEEILNKIVNSKEFRVIEKKDYVIKPKESGYMGYHVIVEVPVETPYGIQNIKTEIQIRTILMDIFAREEHKLSYKGKATTEDKIELRKLSDKLFFYDKAIDQLFKLDPTKTKEATNEELELCSNEFDKVSYFYKNIYELFDDSIKSFIDNYDNKDDILHITSRLKTISSINRKLKERKLKCTAKNILSNIRDVVGFKIVCIDTKVAKEFINSFIETVEKMDKVSIVNISDRLDQPKESGYRGYKLNISYMMPTINGDQPITIEILVRTMVMDAWALHDDKYFNTPKSEIMIKQLKGLSGALHDVEDTLQVIKSKVKSNYSQPDLVKEVELYQENLRKKGTKKLTLQNNEKKDE